MTYQIAQLSQKNALIIADDWRYNDEYAFYNMNEDPEDYEEIISPNLRADHYFQVTTDNNQLVGFFALDSGNNSEQVEVGLGLRPDETGKGKGLEFLQLILKFIKNNYSFSEVALDVAEFNVRAQKVYAKAGFMSQKKHTQETNKSIYPFILMTRKL
ncbi:GNAT family N-acetyltransferase [Pediococcus ethanolidurans]|nr:GNAT family N-acetyltransferase [Pediococcus ethanolidurans]GEN94896.1 N-acetyltransferase [Pediococcus ethanolidurans]SER46408.1 ribosomal-protein-alanine N-acetyltransferase [Pediococcus ethanolidurans]